MIFLNNLFYKKKVKPIHRNYLLMFTESTTLGFFSLDVEEDFWPFSTGIKVL